MKRLGLLQRDAGNPIKLVPFAATVLFAIASVVPLQIPGLAVVTPAFALMAVYHWTIYRPELLPPVGVFVVGLLVDFLNGTPYVGLSALTLLLARSLVLSQRRIFANRLFPVVWAGFLVVASGALALQWAAVSVLHGAALGLRPFVFQDVMTVTLFPLGSYFLGRTQRAVLVQV